MAKGGAAADPKFIENEIYMLERTLNMYKIYAANAKDDKEGWKKRLKGMEERIEEARKRLEKSSH
ncbi:MAG TPA: hypothetical protein VH186_29105 [Chloroflexia bacterium]|nr:hypothetical protein [Chloroflexia bacterium]